MQLNMVTSRSNVAFGGGSRTHEVGKPLLRLVGATPGMQSEGLSKLPISALV